MVSPNMPKDSNVVIVMLHLLCTTISGNFSNQSLIKVKISQKNVYIYFGIFSNHVRKKHQGEQGKFACTLCDFKTFDKFYLKKHISNHEGNFPNF